MKKKRTISVVTPVRGFLIESFKSINSNSLKITITMPKNSYEKTSRKKKIVHRLITMHFFDYFGLFRIVKVKKNIEQRSDYLLSYNRFLKTNKPYFIIVENPYALVHFADRRMNYAVSKLRLKHYFSDNNLRGIICVSKACYNSFNRIYDVPKNVLLYQCYPVIPNGNLKKNYETVNCLFISSQFWLKGGMELIEAFKNIRKKCGNSKIKLRVITPIDLLDKKTKFLLESIGAEVIDYKLDKQQIKEAYNWAHILINPTKMDSSSLVTLESMKYGAVYVGTNPYAIKEMIKDGINGYTIESCYCPWNKDDTFNNKKHAKMAALSKPQKCDDTVAMFVANKIVYLVNNVAKLKIMNQNAYEIANNGVFSELNTCNDWVKIFKKG